MENKTLQQILNEIKQMQASMNISSTITSEEIEAIAKELNNTITQTQDILTNFF